MPKRTQLPDRSTLLAISTIMNIKNQLKKGTASICGYQVRETDTNIPAFNGLFYDDTHVIDYLSDTYRTTYPIIADVTRKNGMSVPETSYGHCELLKTKLPPYLESAPFKIEAAYIVHNNPSSDENYVHIKFSTDPDKNGTIGSLIVGVKTDDPIDIL